MRGSIIGTHADNLDSSSVEILFACRKSFTLDGATRRIVFRIEVNHQPLPSVVAELSDFAILVGKREIGKGIPCRKHDESSFCLVPGKFNKGKRPRTYHHHWFCNA